MTFKKKKRKGEKKICIIRDTLDQVHKSNTTSVGAR